MRELEYISQPLVKEVFCDIIIVNTTYLQYNVRENQVKNCFPN